MNLKLKAGEKGVLVDAFKCAYERALELKETVWVWIDLDEARKGVTFGQKPHVGAMILAEIHYAPDATVPFDAFVFWALVCPGTYRGGDDELGNALRAAVPIRVW